KILVRRSVRLSCRPCPLSVVVAVLPAGGGTGFPSGGKKGGPLPLLLLPTQARLDVDRHRRLVVLDREAVIPPPAEDGLAQVALAEHRVAGEDAARTGKTPSNCKAALCSLVLASTRSCATTAAAAGA